MNVSGDVVEVAITVNPVIHDGAPEGATSRLFAISPPASNSKAPFATRRSSSRSVGSPPGIAHEINTPVQFVNDNVHFLKGSFHTLRAFLDQLKHRVSDPEWDEAALEADWDYLQDEIPKSAAQTLEGLQRIATIVQSMKNFAHNDRGERTIVDLNAALRNTLIVARHELKTVAVAVDDFGDIPKVVCCTGDINQVFLNLVVNAAHAVADVVEQTARWGASASPRAATVMMSSYPSRTPAEASRRTYARTSSSPSSRPSRSVAAAGRGWRSLGA